MAAVPQQPDTRLLRDPAWHERNMWMVVLLAAVGISLVVTEFRPWTLFEPTSLNATKQFVASFFPPAHSAEFLQMVVRGAWNTVAVATAGVTLALIVALPLALVGTRALSISRLGTGRVAFVPNLLRTGVRWILIVLRSVPELVWGLIFVRAIGLGDTAGVMAIALTYTGMMGKVFLEIYESQEARAADVLLMNGAGRVQAFLFGTLPSCVSEMVSYTVFRWECAIRSSVILGFVGAGGLGQQMELSSRMLAGDEVFTMLLAFVFLVWVADVISKRLRAWLD
jgi:phosphonate transport system permease protein